MPPPLVVLIRHGQSEHHVRRLTGGWTDTPLTDLGHTQAHRLADRLRDDFAGVEVEVLTSDLLRASQTATHVAAAFGLEPRVDDRLREFNNGDAIDLTIDEAIQRFPEQMQQPLFASEAPLFPNGESGPGFLRRAGDFLDSLPSSGPVPILVTHGGTIMVLVAHWLGLTSTTMLTVNFMAHPTSVTTLVDGEFKTLERLNDTSHLLGLEGYVPLRQLIPSS